MTSFERIREAKAEAEKFMKQARKEAGELFRLEIRHIFENHPKLESFTWSQYTPYFNDGEECVFRVRNSELKIKYDGIVHEEVGSFSLKMSKEYLDKNKFYGDDHKVFCEAVVYGGLGEAMKEVFVLLEQIDEDDYLDLFGDHVTVTVSKDSINVESDEEHE